MEGIQSLRDIILPGDFMIKLDLRDAYFSIPQYSKQSTLFGALYRWTCLHPGVQNSCHVSSAGNPTTSGGSGCVQTWIEFIGYANPPWGLIGHCVQYTLQQAATIVLITPLWPGQPWYPTLFPLLLDNPRLLPLSPDLLTSPQGLKIPLPERACRSHGTSQAIVPKCRNLR